MLCRPRLLSPEYPDRPHWLLVSCPLAQSRQSENPTTARPYSNSLHGSPWPQIKSHVSLAHELPCLLRHRGLLFRCTFHHHSSPPPPRMLGCSWLHQAQAFSHALFSALSPFSPLGGLSHISPSRLNSGDPSPGAFPGSPPQVRGTAQWWFAPSSDSSPSPSVKVTHPCPLPCDFAALPTRVGGAHFPTPH